jgi:hypothetical protein
MINTILAQTIVRNWTRRLAFIHERGITKTTPMAVKT